MTILSVRDVTGEQAEAERCAARVRTRAVLGREHVCLWPVALRPVPRFVDAHAACPVVEVLEPRMICEPCAEGEHDYCDDFVRYEEYIKWLQAHPFGDKVIGQTETKVIKANRPYDSCPCQHKVKV